MTVETEHIKVIDNSGQVRDEFDAAILRALEMCGLEAEKYAKQLAPNDTGLLKNSITHAIDGQSPAISEYKADRGDGSGSYSGQAPAESGGKRAVYLGTNVEYAVYQELGTGKKTTGGGGRPTPWAYKDDKGVTRRTGGNKAKPYIKPAITNHAEDYRKIIESQLKG